MKLSVTHIDCNGGAMTPSPRTLHAELLRLCARIGYSPQHCP
ncbi:hypothetical protein [Chelativorans sp. ZYF759]|nr:hypothetical protein [Chelativorans sp. ZYF759]